MAIEKSSNSKGLGGLCYAFVLVCQSDIFLYIASTLEAVLKFRRGPWPRIHLSPDASFKFHRAFRRDTLLRRTDRWPNLTASLNPCSAPIRKAF